MQITVQKVGKFTEKQSLKLAQAEAKVNAVLADPKFIEKVKTLKFSDGTPGETVAALLAREDQELVLVAVWYVPWYKRYTKAIAYESAGRVNLRSTYLENGSVDDLAGTLIHEWTHTKGYGHDFWSTKARPTSVPYLIGETLSNWA